jgi:hypothetical protein
MRHRKVARLYDTVAILTWARWDQESVVVRAISPDQQRSSLYYDHTHTEQTKREWRTDSSTYRRQGQIGSSRPPSGGLEDVH